MGWGYSQDLTVDEGSALNDMHKRVSVCGVGGTLGTSLWNMVNSTVVHSQCMESGIKQGSKHFSTNSKNESPLVNNMDVKYTTSCHYTYN